MTASHIVQQLTKLEAEKTAFVNHDRERATLQADGTLSEKERRKRIKALNWPKPTSTKDYSVWYGGHAGVVKTFVRLDAVDIAVGRLEPFDPATVTAYPVFKDPSKDFEPGTSLCKLGFPFHSIKPTYDPASGFVLPADALPLPRFPLDGILTRMAKVTLVGIKPPNFDLEFIETSSPGLRGQSGGPTFDQQGTIWAIQVQTSHYPLGFNTGQTEQFLNVGLGASATTLLPFFDTQGIKYTKSAY